MSAPLLVKPQEKHELAVRTIRAAIVFATLENRLPEKTDDAKGAPTGYSWGHVLPFLERHTGMSLAECILRDWERNGRALDMLRKLGKPLPPIDLESLDKVFQKAAPPSPPKTVDTPFRKPTVKPKPAKQDARRATNLLSPQQEP